MITLTAQIILEDGTKIEIDKRNLSSIDTSIFDRSDTKMPSAGVFSNGGTMKIIDRNKSIADYVQTQKLTDKAKVIITLNNTLKNTHKQIGLLYSSDWKYDAINYEVNVNLKDGLDEWQNIEVPQSIVYKEISGINIYNSLKNETPDKWRFADLDKITAKILSDFKLNNFVLKKGSLWKQWEKLANACGLHIFINPYGLVEVKYVFPNLGGNTNA